MTSGEALDAVSIFNLQSAEFDIAINLDKEEEACKLLTQVKSTEKFGFIWKDNHIDIANSASEHKLFTGLFDDLSKNNTKSYLEEMALFFAHLCLDVSASSILPQGEVLLRYVLPESYGHFKSKLLSDEKQLKKQQVSLHFSPQTIEVPEALVVELTGTLSNYVGARKISEQQERYRLAFAQRQGRLFLESFELIGARSNE